MDLSVPFSFYRDDCFDWVVFFLCFNYCICVYENQVGGNCSWQPLTSVDVCVCICLQENQNQSVGWMLAVCWVLWHINYRRYFRDENLRGKKIYIYTYIDTNTHVDTQANGIHSCKYTHTNTERHVQSKAHKLRPKIFTDNDLRLDINRHRSGI